MAPKKLVKKSKKKKQHAAPMGRPAAIREKSAVLNIRLQPALRARLEARAIALSISLSDAAAIMLDRGLRAAE